MELFHLDLVESPDPGCAVEDDAAAPSGSHVEVPQRLDEEHGASFGVVAGEDNPVDSLGCHVLLHGSESGGGGRKSFRGHLGKHHVLVF